VKPLRDILVRFGAEGVVRLCGLVSFPILARSLGADGYGAVIGTGAVAGLAMSAGGLGLSFHVVRLMQVNDAVANARLLRSLLFITCASGVLLATIVASASSWLAAAFIPHPAAAAALCAAGGSIVCGAMDGVLVEWLRARHRFLTISSLQASQAALQLGAILAVIACGGGVAAVVAAVAATQLLKTGLAWWLLRRAGELAAPGRVEPSACLQLIASASPILTATIAGWVLVQSTRLVVGNRLDADALGAFGAAALVASGIGMLGSACWLQLYPPLGRAVAHGRPSTAAATCRGFGRVFHTAALPTLAIGAVLGGTALRRLAGQSFPETDLACTLLLAAAYVDMACLPWAYLASAHADAARTRNAVLLGGAANVVIALVLVPLSGLAGAATAVLVGQLTVAAVYARTAQIHGHAPLSCLPWRDIAAAAPAAVAAAAVALWLRRDDWNGLLLAGGSACATYAVALASIHRLRMLRRTCP